MEKLTPTQEHLLRYLKKRIDCALNGFSTYEYETRLIVYLLTERANSTTMDTVRDTVVAKEARQIGVMLDCPPGPTE